MAGWVVCNGRVAQSLPERIELTRLEAFQIVAALDDAIELLQETSWLGAVLDLEDGSEILIRKLYPREEE